jgi:hypothetical protein
MDYWILEDQFNKRVRIHRGDCGSLQRRTRPRLGRQQGRQNVARRISKLRGRAGQGQTNPLRSAPASIGTPRSSRRASPRSPRALPPGICRLTVGCDNELAHLARAFRAFPSPRIGLCAANRLRFPRHGEDRRTSREPHIGQRSRASRRERGELLPRVQTSVSMSSSARQTHSLIDFMPSRLPWAHRAVTRQP